MVTPMQSNNVSASPLLSLATQYCELTNPDKRDAKVSKVYLSVSRDNGELNVSPAKGEANRSYTFEECAKNFLEISIESSDSRLLPKSDQEKINRFSTWLQKQAEEYAKPRILEKIVLGVISVLKKLDLFNLLPSAETWKSSNQEKREQVKEAINKWIAPFLQETSSLSPKSSDQSNPQATPGASSSGSSSVVQRKGGGDEGASVSEKERTEILQALSEKQERPPKPSKSAKRGQQAKKTSSAFQTFITKVCAKSAQAPLEETGTFKGVGRGKIHNGVVKRKIRVVREGGEVKIILREYLASGSFSNIYKRSVWSPSAEFHQGAYLKSKKSGEKQAVAAEGREVQQTGDGAGTTAEGVESTQLGEGVSAEDEGLKSKKTDQEGVAAKKAQKEIAHSLEISEVVGKQKSPHVIQMHQVTSLKKGASKTKGILMDLYEKNLWNLPKRALVEVKKDVVRQMALGVKAFHDAGICHMDIKPANFIYRKKQGEETGYEVALTDFGMSELSGTPLATFNGTAPYAAPEVLALKVNKSPVLRTSAMDIFSLGMAMCKVCYDNINDVRKSIPPNEEGWSEAAITRRSEAVEQLQGTLSRIGDPVAKLLARMLAPVPEQRPSIDEVVEALGGQNAPE